MKKRTYFIMIAAILLSLLIPLPQIPFTIILGLLLVATLAFLLTTLIKKKPFYSAPLVFRILLITITVLELHFTKNLIFKDEIKVFGNFIAHINYITGYIVLGVILLFNLFFITNFIYKIVISPNEYTNVNVNLLKIDQDTTLTNEERMNKKKQVVKKAEFYTQLGHAHKKLLSITLFSAFFAILQIVICYLKKYIVLEPTIGNAIGFNFLIFVVITLLELSAYTTAKKFNS